MSGCRVKRGVSPVAPMVAVHGGEGRRVVVGGGGGGEGAEVGVAVAGGVARVPHVQGGITVGGGVAVLWRDIKGVTRLP